MPNTAALVTNFAPRWPQWRLQPTQSTRGSVTFPSTPLAIRVELQLSGTMEDFEDSAYAVTINDISGPLGNGSWSRSNVRSHGGSWSFSGHGGSSTNADMSINVPSGAETLTFWFNVDATTGSPTCTVKVDTMTVFTMNGSTTQDTWLRSATIPVAGASIVRFTCDGDPSNFGDFYIDDLVFSGAWVDVTPYVLYENKIRITRGRQNEQSRASTSTCALTFKNQDKRFSPRNVNGPYYGRFGRNTKLRVSVNPGSGMSTRFTGFIPEWPPQWTSPNDRTVSIQASGVLRRLEQRTTPFRSAIVRATLLAGAGLRQYWPMEDGRDATVALNAVMGQPSMSLTSSVDTAAFNWEEPGGAFTNPRNRHFGTELVPSFADGGVATAKFSGGSNTSWTVQVACYTNPSGSTPMAEWKTPGLTWRLMTSGALTPFVTVNGVTQITCSHTMFSGDVTVTARQNGTNVDLTIQRGYGETPDTDNFAGDLGAITEFTLNPDNTTEANGVYSLSHVRIWDGVDAPTPSLNTSSAITLATSPWLTYDGELATDRFARICTEEDIDYEIGELVVEQQTMGKQESLDRMTLLRQSEDATVGLIDETFDGKLRLSSRTKRYVQNPDLVANYATNDLLSISPTDDDFLIRNDVTTSRSAGGTAQAVLDDGSALSVTSVGRYDDSVELNLFSDDQLSDQAHWRLRAGTVDEVRYPSIDIAFHRSAGQSLISSWLNCDIGSRIQVINPPSDVGPDTIDQSVEGYTETFDQFTWTANIFGSPYSANRVYLLDGALGRMGCKGSTLAEDLDTTETGVDLAITDNCVWGHNTGDYVVSVGGEDMLVTAVGAASGSIGAQTQTLTVTRSYNGAVKTHSIGEQVKIKYPIISAMGA